MKKYSYLNKSQKLLLATIAIPVSVSAMPITENVFANENEIPKLDIYMNENGSPKLEWSTEMLSQNILNQTSFETGDELPNLIYNNSAGQQSFTTETASTGLKSIKLNNVVPGLGNDYSYPSTSSNQSRIQFNERRYIADGTNLSLNMKVKTDKSILISPIGIGGKSDTQITFSKYFSTIEKFELTKDVKIGDKEIYITNPSLFKQKASKGVYYVILNKSENGNYNIGEILNIDEVTGKLTLKNAFNETWKAGEEILIHQNTNPVAFPSRTVNDTKGEWVTVSLNTTVNGKGTYNTLLRGFQFWLRNSSKGTSYIDDIQFGYATEVEVFKEGKSIYRGFLSDFQDASEKDVLKPYKVNQVNTSLTKDNKINFKPMKPSDQSKKISYTIQAIAQNGTRSDMSEPKTVETATDVQKYKYTINQSEKTPSTVSTSTNGLDFDIQLNSLNLEKDYLHIQAIDNNGNASAIQTFKINDIIDDSLLKETYNKMNELEKSNDYTDFIDFIEEVKSLYGENIPKDLKERLNELSNYHGTNTSFLLLEEGDFRLSTADINEFGQIELTAKKQTFTTSFKHDFGVIDARGTQQGWNVIVSATPFTVETFEGFVGEPHQLPLGSLALNPVNRIEQIGNVHNSQVPSIVSSELTVIDGENQAIELLNAEQHKGMGEFKFYFSLDTLSLTVDAVTAKIDTVNYPNQNTPYVSTVTWDLISGPQI